jgi:hypothetical protein
MSTPFSALIPMETRRLDCEPTERGEPMRIQRPGMSLICMTLNSVLELDNLSYPSDAYGDSPDL